MCFTCFAFVKFTAQVPVLCAPPTYIWTFCEQCKCKQAINKLHNMGLYAFEASQDSMPPGKAALDDFDQFNTVFHIYLVLLLRRLVICMWNIRYSYAKHAFVIMWNTRLGLSRSSDLVREVLVYLFHGKCVLHQTQRGKKRSTIIVELRRQHVHGLSIFSKSTQSFSKHVNYVLDHGPWTKDGVHWPEIWNKRLLNSVHARSLDWDNLRLMATDP